LVVFLDFVLGLLDHPRIASQTLRPGRTFIFSIACSTRSICTCVCSMCLNALAQCFGTGLAQCPLHAAQRLLFGAVSILRFLDQQFADFRLHMSISCVFWLCPGG
jgi:hypothetical protein